MSQSTEKSELSIREVVCRIKNVTRYLWKYRISIFIAVLLGSATGFFIATLSTPKYTAHITFVVEDSKGGGGALSAYAGLASSFGFDLGGGNSGLFQGENIFEFLKSRQIVQKALLRQYPLDTTRTFADVYYGISKLKEEWDKLERTKGVHFPAGIATLSPLQDSALGKMYGSIYESLDISKKDKRLSIVRASYTNTDELYAKYYVEAVVSEAANLYVQTKMQRSQNNVNNLQKKADSLLVVMNRNTYAAASSQGINLNPGMFTLNVPTEMHIRDKMIAQTVFAEVIKNLEMAKMSLAQDTPLIEVIDKPFLPLSKKRMSRSISIVLGGFITGIFMIGFIGVRKLIRDN